MARKKRKAKKVNRVYRRNPDADVGYSGFLGFPHDEDDLKQAARVFARDYDRIRGTLEEKSSLSPTEIAARAEEAPKSKYILSPAEIAARVREVAKSKVIIDKKKKDIANFLSTVDFQPYYDSLFHFQYDLEGFLEALRSRYGKKGSAGSRDLHKQYSLVLRKCKALITVLKQLHRPSNQEGEDIWSDADLPDEAESGWDDDDEDEFAE
jgi:hypothetical protein